MCMAPIRQLPESEIMAVLSGPELARGSRIRHHAPWRHFALTRGLLRLLLAYRSGCPPASLDIRDGDGMAPRLAENPGGLNFSVSHSHDWVAVAVGSQPLGIDIEQVDQQADCEDIAGVCFHARERAFLRAIAREKRAEAFFDIWTRKEAVLKATGRGFSADTLRFSTVPFDGAVTLENAARDRHRWHVRPLSAPDGYKAALASSAPSRDVIYVEAAALASGGRGPGFHQQLPPSRSISTAADRPVAPFCY